MDHVYRPDGNTRPQTIQKFYQTRIALHALSILIPEVEADSPLGSYTEWPVDGHCRMNAYCTIVLAEPYSPQAARQWFSVKVTLENHATGMYEVNKPI